MLVKGGHIGGVAMLLSAKANPNLQSRPTDDEYRSGQWGRTNSDGTKEVLRAADDKSPLHLAIGCEEPNPMMICAASTCRSPRCSSKRAPTPRWAATRSAWLTP